MKILLIAPHPFFEARGSPIAERALLRALSERGHELHVLAYAEGEEPEIPGCTIHRIPDIPGVRDVPPGFSWKKLVNDGALLASCVRLARRLRPDVLHAVEESVFLAHLVGWRLGIPVVYDMDSSLPNQMMAQYPWLRIARPLLRAAERFAVRRSSGVVVMSRYLEDIARGHLEDGTPLARIEDTSLLDTHSEGEESVRETIGRPESRLVLYVGNLAPYQGIDLLLEAFARAARQVADAELVIIGGREERIEDYRRKAEELGVSERTHFLGPRPLSMLGTFLKQADVLVSPRVDGGNTPLKLYSYLDSGRPVLATRLPTHTQVLDERTARLVEPEPSAFGRGMVELLRDRELRRGLAARARERVRREYSTEAFTSKVQDFYARLERRLTGAQEKEKEDGRSSERRRAERRRGTGVGPRSEEERRQVPVLRDPGGYSG